MSRTPSWKRDETGMVNAVLDQLERQLHPPSSTAPPGSDDGGAPADYRLG